MTVLWRIYTIIYALSELVTFVFFEENTPTFNMNNIVIISRHNKKWQKRWTKLVISISIYAGLRHEKSVKSVIFADFCLLSKQWITANIGIGNGKNKILKQNSKKLFPRYIPKI